MKKIPDRCKFFLAAEKTYLQFLQEYILGNTHLNHSCAYSMDYNECVVPDSSRM